MPHLLEAHNLLLGYGDKIVAPQISLSFPEPEIVAIIGPNGSGKSTVLKALSRLLKPSGGTVLLDGREIHRLPSREVARIMAILPQGAQAPGDFAVYDLVAFGRSPHRKFFDELLAEDRRIIQQSIAATGLTELAYRRLDTLSGGERQRAWLAMALAQQPEILMLDEPTTYLDIHHQLELMKLIQRLYEELQLTVIMVLHDLNQAARFCHRVIAVKNGAVFADGPVDRVLTRETLRELYGVETIVTTVTQEGRTQLVCLPHDVCCPA
jgi:iron complex transport system ATP-binding protein